MIVVMTMSFGNDEEFRRYLESSENVYADVSRIAREARSLANDMNNKLLHSDAITCAVHGTSPECEMWRDAEDEYEATVIRDMFCSIEDKAVCDAVYDSYYDSKDARHLIYVYNKIKDKPRQARVRILTRMLWYKLQA